MTDAPAPRLSATRARQGRRGLHIFWVLAISVVLAALALLAVWAFNWGDFRVVRGSTQAPAAAAASNFDAPAPAARQDAPESTVQP